MKKIVDRSARYNLVVPVFFDADNVLIEGVSVNVSESGVLALFNQPVEILVTGEISMILGEDTVSIEAWTARILGNYVGLSFLIENVKDRLTVNLIIDYAMTQEQSDIPV